MALRDTNEEPPGKALAEAGVTFLAGAKGKKAPVGPLRLRPEGQKRGDRRAYRKSVRAKRAHTRGLWPSMGHKRG